MERNAYAAISRSTTHAQITLTLLATPDVRRILTVSRHHEHPISQLIFCHRRCKATPPQDIKTLVQALSVQEGSRSFTGESSEHGSYIGNNIWGCGFETRSTYCPGCGYAMEGPQIHHVQIVRSSDVAWNQMMVDQCEIGAWWDEGKNLGLTYEFIGKDESEVEDA